MSREVLEKQVKATQSVDGVPLTVLTSEKMTKHQLIGGILVGSKTLGVLDHKERKRERERERERVKMYLDVSSLLHSCKILKPKYFYYEKKIMHVIIFIEFALQAQQDISALIWNLATAGELNGKLCFIKSHINFKSPSIHNLTALSSHLR